MRFCAPVGGVYGASILPYNLDGKGDEDQMPKAMRMRKAIVTYVANAKQKKRTRRSKFAKHADNVRSVHRTPHKSNNEAKRQP